MAVGIKITLNDQFYLRDPQQTTLGQNIIRHSILMMDEMGFECFTFRKLAQQMGSTEASVYRYFENKHLLLTYLVSWYWEWVGYLIDVNTMNIDDPKKRLRIIIENFVLASEENPGTEYVNENVLHRVVIAEASKVYHTKEVDTENKSGFFANYKELVEKVSKVILDIVPSFPYPHAMASNLFEMTNNQIYFAQHLPKLTDVKVKKGNLSEVVRMISYFAFTLLQCEEGS